MFFVFIYHIGHCYTEIGSVHVGACVVDSHQSEGAGLKWRLNCALKTGGPVRL